MHSTMFRRGWLLGALTALVLATPFTYASGESGPSNPEMEAGPTSKLATTCYFGEPSESCTFTCSQKSMDAYCDDKLKQCVCRDKEDKGNSNVETTEQEENTEKPESEEEGTQLSAVTDHPKTNFRLSDFCIYGYPSPPCVLHCDKQSLKAYCDEDEQVCVCRKPPEEGFNVDWYNILQSVLGGDTSEETSNPMENLAGSSTGINTDLLSLWKQIQGGMSDDEQNSDEESSDEEESSPEEEDQYHQLVFYIFDFDSLFNNTETTSTPNTTQFSATHPALRHVGKAIEGWAFSHVLAIVLIVFLFGLVLLEMAFCFKKKDPNPQMETIFPTKK